MQFKRCIFETDAKVLVDACKGVWGLSLFDTIVEDCVELAKHFDEVLFVYVNRFANSVAHVLARAAHSISGLSEWHVNAPEFIHQNIVSDIS